MITTMTITIWYSNWRSYYSTRRQKYKKSTDWGLISWMILYIAK